MQIVSAGRVDKGRVRPDNDNAFYVSPTGELLLVSNGNSGVKGLVASEMLVAAVKAGEQGLYEASKVQDDRERRTRLLHAAATIVNDASKQIFQRAAKDPALSAMSASGTFVYLNGQSAVVAHVGHNTIFHVRGDRIQRLNVYHTIAEEMLRKGQLKAVNPATTEYAYVLSRSIGMLPSTQTDTLWLDLLPGDMLVLCTKGLTQHVEADEISKIVGGEKVEVAIERLIALANERGGQDNMAVVVARLGEDAPMPGRPRRVRLDSDSQIATLQRIPLFQYLSFEEMLSVLKIVYEKELQPGQVIVQEGTDGADLFVVSEGEVAVETRGVALTKLGPGRPFGELSFIDGGQRSATVKCSDQGPVTLLTLSREDLNATLAKDDPRVAAKLFWSMAQNIAHRLRELTDDFVGVTQALHAPAPAAPAKAAAPAAAKKPAPAAKAEGDAAAAAAPAAGGDDAAAAKAAKIAAAMAKAAAAKAAKAAAAKKG